ncbi:Transglycosylase [Planctomycetales bacterium 10988]|nr:Transglycosylase [Planctomycetales bacterium 10988]
MEIIVAIIGWILFGLVIGAIARFLVPGRQTMSYLMTTLLGMIGSVAGGVLMYFFSGAPNGEEFAFQPSGWLMSIVGAVVVLLIYIQLIQRRADTV